ncbi:ankyrin-3-like isoform X2 [Culicoides brevitarsis]|uniref:ankyrin-3-like isoform X2 n=1 Tax=Culicoides brevitarsis TaxID=469753 RepID=UPI00307B6D89
MALEENQQQQQQQQTEQQTAIETTAETTNNIGNGTNGVQKPVKNVEKQADTNTSFLRAARGGELGKLVEFLETGQILDINTSNANGLNALHLAAKDGHIEIVRELLNRGAKVDNATKKGNTALHISSLAGKLDVIQLLVQHGASVNVQSQNGFTPLYMAAQENHDECVKYLLAKGANPALATEDGFTPLAVAMQQGHDKVVAVLLESDAKGKVRLPALHIAAKKDDAKAAALLLENDHNPDISSKSGFTPLHISAHYGNVDVANLLIEKGADVNFTAKHNITPLHVACKWGKTNMVNLLIPKGAKIDAVTRDGLTPLHCAARSGHEEVVDILLKHDAPIWSKTKNGLTALHMAAQGEHVEAARILLHHNNVDEVTVDYLTALHVAAHCGHVKVAKLLLDRNADANARALNGFTPLHIACKKNRIKVVELLLKHGASISATTESGLTPLHVASFMGCMNIVIYLLQHEASPDVPTVRGETPLHLAARANQTDIIRILLRNGAQVDARAREQQTPLHIASRLGNIDIVMLLLQHGAQVDATTKDQYTALHIAAKEGQDEVVATLLENGAQIDAQTKKKFTPLHLAAKYGHINVVRQLLEKNAPVDAQGKNNVTPLHVASHYDHQNVALLLLEKGADAHAVAKNGHSPLHISAKKNQMDIANILLEHGANPNAESKSGFTPLHLSSKEGHAEMTSLLLEKQANPNHAAKNGLTPMHLCAEEDRVAVAQILYDNGAKVNPVTKSGFTPLHVAAHFGQVEMVRFLVEHDADIEMNTNVGYTPLHQAAQQGHTLIINLLLKHRANPNAVANNGQTPLSLANKLGYITIVETLKVVTETNVTSTSTGTVEEKYKVIAPEGMHETFMSDSEDEGGADEPNVNETMNVVFSNAQTPPHQLPFYQNQMRYTRGEDPSLSDHQQYNYMSGDESKHLQDDHYQMDVTGDEKMVERILSDAEKYNYMEKSRMSRDSTPNPLDISVTDNCQIVRNPIHAGFLVSFLVDARGGAMRGCRHSGVRVIVPPKSAAQPTRITCRYVKPQRISNPPPLMEGEALVSRILQLSPAAAKFLGPVIIEVPHFASLREKEREIIILRSDNGDTWREHTLYDSEEAIQDVLNESFKSESLNLIEDLHTSRITRIVTNDFPNFFAIVSRIRQEVHAIGPDGGTVSATAVPQVQAIFPPNALTKKIRVGLQAQPIDPNVTAKLLGRSVAVSPVVTVEPRRRKFHKAITLSMPAPRAYNQGMINQYSGNAPTLRLLCSITGGQNRAVWEDVTGSTPLTFVKDCVSFTTTVSARFWLMDCRNISDATKMASELYSHMAHVPFMAKFVIFAKRVDPQEAQVRVFCMTDDKEDKTLEQQEHFTEVAKSRDIEVCEGRNIYLEFAGNIVQVLKSGEQLNMKFSAFKENRLAFNVRLRETDDGIGRIVFMNEPKVAKGEPAQTPLCTLNFQVPEKIIGSESHSEVDISGSYNQKYNMPSFLLQKQQEEILKADIRISDISILLNNDWEKLAHELQVSNEDIALIKEEYPQDEKQQASVLLRLWLRQGGPKATGNELALALNKIQRNDIVEQCMKDVQIVTDDYEKQKAQKQLEHAQVHAPAIVEEKLKREIVIENNHVNGGSESHDLPEEIIEKVKEEVTKVAPPSKSAPQVETPPPTPAAEDEVHEQIIEKIVVETHSEPTVTIVEKTEVITHPDNAELEKLDGSNKKKQKKNDLNQRFINEEKLSKIPVATNNSSVVTTTTKKVKTIKKHSKARKNLNVQDVVQPRPTVGDIEWGEEKRDTERECEDIDDDNDAEEDEQEIDPNEVIKEISTLALEDVHQLSSLDQSDPIVLISSGDDDYSGDIDEFILIEAPNSYTQARQLQREQREAAAAAHENKTISTTTTRAFDAEGRETVTIRREEHGPDGEVIITEETHDSNDYPPPSNVTFSGSDTDEQLSPVDEVHESHVKTTHRGKTFGSSSGSDVALHEPGAADSSEDETDDDILVSEQPVTTTETDTNVEEIVNEDGSTTIVKTTTITTNTVVTTTSTDENEPEKLLY